MNIKKPEVSVIVPALNEEKYIRYAFEGLSKQTFRNFEVIVVDGGSTDRTRDISRKHARVIVDRKEGIGRARNAGAAAARGRILVFIDADTKPSPQLLSVYSKAFADRNTVSATGPILPLEHTTEAVETGYRIVSVLFVKLTLALHRPSVIGSNFAVTREAFRKAGGFNPKLITYEDWDLSHRLHRLGRILYIDDAVVYTSVRRVAEWGIFGFFKFHVGNMFRYNLFKKPKTSYNPVR